MQREQELLEEIAQKQGEIKRRLSMREEELSKLKIEQRRTAIMAIERERDQAVAEAEALLREKLALDSKVASTQSTLDTLKPGYDQVRIQLRALETEIRREESRVEAAHKKSEELQQEMSKLTEEKARLVDALASVGQERRKYEDRFSEIEKSLSQLIDRMDPLNSNVSELKASLRELETQLTMLTAQLRNLGFDKPLETTPGAIEAATKLMAALERELSEIGLVNQLAVKDYEEIKNGYKHLSVQQIHPMPFYIMDEIDAHLDVLNAKRLATLVKSKSTDSQFVVISLKDTTISRADRVFGVYIDQGQSQVISLPNKGGVED